MLKKLIMLTLILLTVMSLTASDKLNTNLIENPIFQISTNDFNESLNEAYNRGYDRGVEDSTQANEALKKQVSVLNDENEVLKTRVNALVVVAASCVLGASLVIAFK